MPDSSSDKETRVLAEWLERNRLKIVAEWIDAIQDDPAIPNADHLTLAALKDHFPEMLEEVVEALRAPLHVLEAATRELGDKHAKGRWRHQYRLDELLHELARIREILLGHVRRFCAEHDLSECRDRAEERIRKFFDLIVAQSARQFMREQEAELNLRTKQLDEAHEQIQAATEQLRVTAAARFRMLKGVSHELRNAFQDVTIGAADLLDEDHLAERGSIRDTVTRNAARLQGVLDRLQQFSNILAGETRLHVELLNMTDFLEKLGKTHRRRAERKGLELKWQEEAGLEGVKTDVEKLRHIADILLSNAIEYTESGAIEVTARWVENDRWCFRVADTGVGIPERDAKMVFHEFHRSSSRSRYGVGLGLIIARYLVHLMHGDISFESHEGKGSVFEVQLPTDLSALAA